MNREILFRGKRVDNSGWVEGDFLHGVGNYKKGKAYILPVVENLAHLPGCHPLDGFEVVPETVGQYTGLKDKNGTKIFEGDILCSPMERHYPVTFKDGSFVAHLGIVFYTKDIWNNGPIVGNIHDNPDLLK